MTPIKKTIKKSNITDLVGNVKMNLPIGKLYSLKKSENKESKKPVITTTKKDMTEKWSQKYKDSINCSNPKGFSQRAHCQGRKKNA